MHRRELLTLCGAGLASLAGCASRQPEGRRTTDSAGGSTPTTPDTTSQSPTPEDVELTVELDALQPALVVLNVDYLEVHSNSSSQYLYLHVSAPTEPAPTLSDLSVRFDGESHAPLGLEELPEVYRRYDSESAPHYDPEEGSGWVLFELPATGDASDAALVWPGGEWHPDEQLRTRLAAPFPPLSVERWETQPTVALDEQTTFEIGVKNAGDVTGQFVGGINADGWYPHRPIAQVSREIPPGEAVTWGIPGEEIELVEGGMADQVGDGDADVDYELIWPGGSRSRSVRVVGK